MAPAPLEEQLKLSPYILNAMLFGDNRPHNVALIVPDMASLKQWSTRHGIVTTSDEELLAHPRALALIQEEVDRYAAGWRGFERVHKVTLIAEDFTTQNGYLTPTLKLKRRVALQTYGARIEALYRE